MRTSPTCAKSGEEMRECTVCENVKDARLVPPNDDHVSETIGGKAPTCTVSGLTAGEKCGVCGEIITPQDEISPRHNISNGVCVYCNKTFSMGLEYGINDDGDYYVLGMGTCTDTELYILSFCTVIAYFSLPTTVTVLLSRVVSPISVASCSTVTVAPVGQVSIAVRRSS